MMNTIGRLVILFNDNAIWDIADDVEVMRAQYRRLCEALESLDGTVSKFFEIRGFSTKVERSPESISVKLEDVRAVSFQTLHVENY